MQVTLFWYYVWFLIIKLINVCRCATQHEIYSPHQGDCHWISQCALLYAALRNLAISRSCLVSWSSSLRLPHSSVALSGAGTASANYRGVMLKKRLRGHCPPIPSLALLPWFVATSSIHLSIQSPLHDGTG